MKEIDSRIKQQFSTIEKSLETGSFQKVLDELDRINCNILPIDMLADYYLYLVEASIQMSCYNVSSQLLIAKNHFLENNCQNKYARIRYCEGLSLVYKGNFVDAKESLYEAFLIFKRLRDKRRQIIALNRIAYVYYHSGDYRSTIDYLLRSLDLIDKTDTERLAVANFNIAQIYRIRGDVQKSKSTYARIDKSIWDVASQNYIAYILQSSILHASMGDILLASSALSDLQLSIKSQSREQAIYFETIGWIHNLESKYDLALTELTKGLKIADEIAPESALMSQIKRRMADSYLGLKDYKLAELFASEALAVAEKLNERVEIAECWRIQAEIAHYNGESDRSKKLFKKAIDMFNMIGTKYNLAACRFIAATSGLYHNGEHQALLYLACEYFESENVTHYIKKIDDALSEPSSQITKKQKVSQSNSIVVAASPKMRKIVKLAEMIAPSPISVLLTGETGTGKDHLAKFIHDNSKCEGEFVAVNIAAIPETMLEAELFGYRKGAFTGADQSKPGLFEQADKGTFFLNEVSSASAAIQAKLLDVLERRKIRRLGENTERDASFRLLSASNRDLEEMIRQNEFRADLYHRIKQEEIKLPPLKERSEDILELVKHFLDQFGIKCHQDQVQLIASRYTSHTWPGNVRELKAEIERLAMMNDNNLAKIIDSSDSGNGSEIEQLQILLEKHNWNRSKVASELGISEGGVRYRMRKFKLL